MVTTPSMHADKASRSKLNNANSQPKSCLWKLVAAAAVILAGMISAIGLTDHKHSAGFAMSAPAHADHL